MNEADANAMPCRYCGEIIKREARICKYCEKYTNNNLNRLLYFSTISSGIAILAAGIAYTAGQAWDIYKIKTKQDKVELVSLQTGFNLDAKVSIANFGNESIFVHGITVYYGGNGEKNITYPVFITIEAGKVETTDDDIRDKEELFSSYRFIGLPINYDAKYRELILNDSATPQLGESNKTPCFYRVFYEKYSPHLKRMEDTYKKDGLYFLTTKERMVITYSSFIEKRTKEVQVDIVSAYLRHVHPSCLEEYILAKKTD